MLGGELVLGSDQVLIADDGSTIAGQTHVTCPSMSMTTDVVCMADTNTSRLAVIAAEQSRSMIRHSTRRGGSTFEARSGRGGGGVVVVGHYDLR